MTVIDPKLAAIVDQFAIDGDVKGITAYGDGHINVTFLINTDQHRYILQKMNTDIFPDTVHLMRNIELVTAYLRSKNQETLDIVPTKDGASYIENEEVGRAPGGYTSSSKAPSPTTSSPTPTCSASPAPRSASSRTSWPASTPPS